MKTLMLSTALVALMAGGASALSTVQATNNAITGNADAGFNDPSQSFVFDPIVASAGNAITTANLFITLNWAVTGTAGPLAEGGSIQVSTELDLDVSNVDFGSLSGSFGPFPGDGNAEFETTGSSGTVNLPAGETVDIAYALDPEQEGTFSLDDNLGLLGDGLSFDVATLTSTIARVTGGGSVETNLTTGVTASARIEYEEAAVVPVPAALPLMLGALGGLGFLGWRKRQT